MMYLERNNMKKLARLIHDDTALDELAELFRTPDWNSIPMHTISAIIELTGRSTESKQEEE